MEEDDVIGTMACRAVQVGAGGAVQVGAGEGVGCACASTHARAVPCPALGEERDGFCGRVGWLQCTLDPSPSPLQLQEGIAVAVASPDKDFFQLLRPGIILLRPPRKLPPSGAGERASAAAAAAGAASNSNSKYALVPYAAADFEQEFGLQPRQFVDVLALAGDASGESTGRRQRLWAGGLLGVR